MSATGKDFKVLIIDDSPVSRKLVELPLAQKQYRLIFAKTGQEALKLFEEHRPDLVILDWVMPDLSGEEMCRRLRSSSQDSYCYIYRADRQHRQGLSCRRIRCRCRRPCPVMASEFNNGWKSERMGCQPCKSKLLSRPTAPQQSFTVKK